MSQMTTTNSSKPNGPQSSTGTQGSTGRAVKSLRLRELSGVPWLLGVLIEGKDSLQRPLTMTRQRMSVLIEGQLGACEIPDAMIKSIEYVKDA